MLFPQPGRGVVGGNQRHQAFPLNPKQPITAWGLIGSAIRAYDYMDGVSNRYGVHTVILEVDSVEVFRSVVDRFSENENRMINSWTYGQYMKSFIEPGNTLRMLHAPNGNRGLIEINEERPYHFVYTLKDPPCSLLPGGWRSFWPQSWRRPRHQKHWCSGHWGGCRRWYKRSARRWRCI